MFTHADEFAQRPLLAATATAYHDPSWMLSGTNAAESGVTGKSGGGWTVATAGASGDAAIVSPRSTSGASSPYSSGWTTRSLLLARWVVSATTATAQRVEFGLRPTLTAFDDTTDDDKIVVRAIDGGNLYVVTSNAGTDATEDTGVLWDIGREYVIEARVVYGDAPAVLVSVDGRLVNTPSSHLLDASDANLGLPYFAVKATAAAVKSFGLHAIRLGRA